MDLFPPPQDYSNDIFPDVFAKPPDNLSFGKPGQLSREQIQQYFDDGFLIVPDYFDASDLDPIKKDIEEHTDCLINLMHKAGIITDAHSDLGLFQRLTEIEKQYAGASNLFYKSGLLPQAVKNLWTKPKLLNLVEQFLGTPDIQGHPIWNFRPKIPRTESGEVPWHQDIGYTDKDSHKVMQLTAWIPFLDANKNNGCMELLRGGHKAGKVLPHYSCWRDTHMVEIMEDEMQKMLGLNVKENTVLCEVPEGSMLLFSNIIPHRSIPNVSNDIRWSIDLRWQRCDQPVAFHGLKEGVRFRSSTDPDYKIDWSPFQSFDTIQEAFNAATKNGTDFNSELGGPWIAKWPIVHTNRHVEGYKRALQEPGGKGSIPWHAIKGNA